MFNKEPSIYQNLEESAYSKYQNHWDQLCDELNKKALAALEEKKAKKSLPDNSKFDKSHKRKKYLIK